MSGNLKIINVTIANVAVAMLVFVVLMWSPSNCELHHDDYSRGCSRNSSAECSNQLNQEDKETFNKARGYEAYGNSVTCRKGWCLTHQQCQHVSGYYWGLCTLPDSTSGVCCHIAHKKTPKESCNLISSEPQVLFESPGFPGPVGQPVVCSLALVTSPGDCGVRLDFVRANLTPSMDVVCYQDIVMLISSPSTVQSAPFCGMIEGYSRKDACGLRGPRHARHRWDKVGEWDKVVLKKKEQDIPSTHSNKAHSMKQEAEKFLAAFNLRNDIDYGDVSEYSKNVNNSKEENYEQVPSNINAAVRGHQDSRFRFIIPVEININEQHGGIFQQNIFNIAIQLWKPDGTDDKGTGLQPKQKDSQSTGNTNLDLIAENGPNKNATRTSITEVADKHSLGKLGTISDSTSEHPVKKLDSTDGSIRQSDVQPPKEELADDTTRILGGNPVLPHQFPWLAALLLDGELQCGAVIISHRWLLTAAHCVTLYSSSQPLLARFSVYLGAHDISALSEPQRLQMTLSRVVFHPGHLTILRDIALLELKESISYSSVIRPICLPNAEQFEALEEAGTLSEVLGWGEVGNGQVSALPLLAPVQVVGRSTCQRAWAALGVTLPPYTLCSGSPTAGTCNGDSGGALMAQDVDGLYYATGIISFGAPKCGTPGIPDVHTRIVSYLNWISLVTSDGGAWNYS
ncbi:uncharacterized protein LOC126355792 isoform X3 [Schistocerca gregaria]|uniref:uncharacterized protein LOC126355792 isoform X3 n=1 Tax=Schistocerca gregaria TaxID=7010 RepID=UPI00211DC0D5|nr:uncharacterized protein LOC126355792 isoform X3 [Schistocerca gregaria]